jgi:dynein heavy chain
MHAHTTHPQRLLGDCFDNLAKLDLSADGKVATGMHSKDGGEFVAWLEPLKLQGAVEHWLQALELHVQATLRALLARAKLAADIWEIDKPRHQWVFDHASQIAQTASQIHWTEEVTHQFESLADGNEQAMKDYLKTCSARLEHLIALVLGEMNPRDRVKVMTLITVDVHNRDVVQTLVDDKVADALQFAWQSVMRYVFPPQIYLKCII